ncbi:cell division protein ZapA [Brachymonas chironomi]|uniref:cell division protein ZapA n=1 Tax=Brachymonas chironomi TaxID=491919 RepID=UPI000372F963|nr:cell division protein ZapA [Brachymonas chironomi]
MKQLEKSIMGQAYVLACPDDSEAQMNEAVARVDAAMCRIRDAGKIRARERIAVLAALNLAFDMIQQEQQVQTQTLPLAVSGDGLPDEEQLQAQARLQALMARMDEALAEDGRLI